jgi:hypothetical protein
MADKISPLYPNHGEVKRGSASLYLLGREKDKRGGLANISGE